MRKAFRAMVLGMSLLLMLLSGMMANAGVTAKFQYQIKINYYFLIKPETKGTLLLPNGAVYDVTWKGQVFSDQQELEKLRIRLDQAVVPQPFSHMALALTPNKVWALVDKGEEGKQQYIITDDSYQWNKSDKTLAGISINEGEAEEFNMYNYPVLVTVSKNQVSRTLNEMFNKTGPNNWSVIMHDLPRDRESTL